MRSIYQATYHSLLTLSITLLCFFTSCNEDESPADEFEASISISGPSSVNEGDGTIQFTINLDEAPSTDLTINIQLAGSAMITSDFTHPGNSITINSGSTSTSVSIEIVDDQVVEDDETILITIDDTTLPNGVTLGSQSSISITIIDNDETTGTYTLSIEGMSTVNESDPGTGFKIKSTPSNNTGDDITVTFTLAGTATEGSDYQNITKSASIPNGDDEVMVNIPLINDADDEGDETIIITLSDSGLGEGVSVGNQSSLTITIEDDDTGSGTCSNDNSINQDNHPCSETPSVSNSYSESVSGNTRTVTTNGIPTHDYRNQIPNIVSELNSSTRTFTMDATPTLSSTVTSITNEGMPVWRFGVATNGVPIDPAPAQPFIFEDANTGEFNFDWVFEPNWNMEAVGLDCAIAHVQPDGTYHYHGDMGVYADQLLSGLGSGTTTPTEAVQIGWAADGFPILYKYGPDANGTFKLLASSYSLKEGDRPGDGITEPCGEYNGKYTNDFEFVSGSGDLDECNGISQSITLDGETFEYFYVITAEFPIISRCISGSPDDSFRLGM